MRTDEKEEAFKECDSDVPDCLSETFSTRTFSYYQGVKGIFGGGAEGQVCQVDMGEMVRESDSSW